MENVPFMPNKYGLDSLFPVAKAFDDLFSIDFPTVKLIVINKRIFDISENQKFAS